MALTEQEIRKNHRRDRAQPVRRAEGGLAQFRTRAQGRLYGRWLCDTAEEAIANAKRAQEKLADSTLEKRAELVEAMRKAAIENAEYLAKVASEETGYGRVADKVQKNLLVARRTPGVEGPDHLLQDRRQRHDDRGAGALRRHRLHHALHQPHRHGDQQLHQHDRRGQRGGIHPHPSAKRASQEAMRVLERGHRQGGRAGNADYHRQGADAGEAGSKS